jgi:hypothetical protein
VQPQHLTIEQKERIAMKSPYRFTPFLLVVILCVLASGSRAALPVVAAGTTYVDGDVFIGVANGQVQWRGPDGTLKKTLTTGEGGFTTGMAFDRSDNLYVTNFSANSLSKFDNSGNLLGNFGSGYDSSPESIVFDAAGDAYVGHATGARAIRKVDSSGTLLETFSVQIENVGTDWIDLADDQCTLYYTSEGPNIKRYNVCTRAQLPNFNTTSLPGANAFALRILSTGGVIVADRSVIVRLNTSGQVIQTYDAPGEDCWFALNLDPDAESLWSADFCTSNVYRFDLATGNVLKTFNTGTPTSTVYGLTVKGEMTAAQPCALPAFGDTLGNPIQQNTEAMGAAPYGGREFDIPGRGRVFLPFRWDVGNDNIRRWGCYMISGAMIINYFAAQQGVLHRTDPVTLNNWMAHNLTNSNSGYSSGPPLPSLQNPQYVASAFVDAATLVQYATAHGIDMSVAQNTSGRTIANDQLLNAAMCDLNPAILGVNGNGHYVDATAKLNVRGTATWRLHDSLSATPTNLLDAYGNNYGKLVIVDGNKPQRAFLLSLYSPAEILVTDPMGRRTGLDPRTDTTYEEIPSSSYGQEFLAGDGEGAPVLLERKALWVSKPISGDYRVEIIGTGDGTIGLDVVPIDDNGNGPRMSISDQVITGRANVYHFTYSGTPGEPSRFTRRVYLPAVLRQ